MTDATSPPTEPSDTGPIVARAGGYYRKARYLIVLAAIVGGAFFLYDGYVRYPRQNREAIARNSKPPHAESDLALQKKIGYALPPLGIAMLIWTLYRSRGQYRLDDETLHVPGHPPVPLEQIRRVDNSLWERKGIARIAYELADGTQGELTLDDFVYERKPTDSIYERITAYVRAAAGEAAPPEETTTSEDQAN